MRTRPSLLLALVLTLIVSVGGCGDRIVSPRDGEEAGGGLEPLAELSGGDPVPATELPRLEGDGELRPHELSEPAVINFWASWCTFCIDEMPAFEQVHQDLRDDVVFVGVNQQDNLEEARRLADETGVTYELVVDADGSFFRDVRGRGMPTTLFVDEDGVIVHRHTGPLTAEQLHGLVREHLSI